MAAAIPLVAQVVAAGIISGLKISGVAASLIMAGATLLGGYAASKLAGSKVKLELRANYVSTDKALPIIYGTRLIGSNDVFAEVGRSGGTPPDPWPNLCPETFESTPESLSLGSSGKFIWVVHTLCEGEIEGINQVEFEEELFDEVYIDGDPLWKMKPGTYRKIRYCLYPGTNDQEANPYLVTGTRLGKEEKATDTYRNTAYIVFRIRYGKGHFTGIPRREVAIKGIKCLDVRSPLDDPAWTDNPALILYDYMTNTRYGLGWSPSEFDTDSFGAVATLCETYGWSLNYIIGSRVQAQSVIDTILGHFRGALYWWDGKISLRYLDLDYETSLFAIEDKHIARDTEGRASVTVSQPSTFNIPDGVIVSYMNRRNNWTKDSIVVGERLGQTKAIDFVGYTDRDLALKMGTYTLERQLLNRTYTFTLRPDVVALDTNDLIQFTSSELRVTNQLGRVKSNNIGSDGSIGLTVVLEKPELYDREFNPDNSDVYGVDFPGINIPPPSVIDVAVTEETYFYRERSFVRMKVTFSYPDVYPWFDHVNVYVAYPVGGETPPESAYLHARAAYDSFQIDPVEESQVYYIKLVAVSTYGVEEDFEDVIPVVYTVDGVSGEYPVCLTSLKAVVNLAAIDLETNLISHKDISGYEFRLGSNVVSPVPTWSGAAFLSFNSGPALSFSGVKPGEHLFWANTKHKNGLYCLDPVSTTSVIEDPPPGSHNYMELVLNYSLGTPTNLIISGTYPNQEFKVDHSGGYVGDYVSAEIDLDPDEINIGCKTVVYVLFDFYQDGVGSSWNAVTPKPDTWNDFAGSGETWVDVLGPIDREEAAQIEVSIESSDTSGTPYEYVSERMELLYAVIEGRYARVTFKITDVNKARYMVVKAATFKAGYLEKTYLIGV